MTPDIPPALLADQFTLRRRPPSEKLVDLGFRQLTLCLASVVALLLLGIFFTPLFFVVVQRLFGRRKPVARTDTAGPGAG